MTSGRLTRVVTAVNASLLVLSLAGAVPARAVEQGPYSLEVLVNGRPLNELAGNGRNYVEALAGREYSLRLTNHTGRRVAIAVSVDGLNSVDAKTTTAEDATKWILGPYEAIVLDGWQTSSALARHFFFTTEKKSYGAWLGQTANLGVIAAVVYRERMIMPRRPVPYVAPAPPPSDGPGSGFESATPGSAGRMEQSSPPVEGNSLGGSAPQAKPKSEVRAVPDEYAATGIGREVGHDIEFVPFDAERRPAAQLELRYEYRPALVKLGLLPPNRSKDPLDRRERAHGFEPGFAPDPYRGDGSQR